MGDCFYKRTEPKDSVDYFATPPKAVRMLCKRERFRSRILEPCCGEGHISRTLEELGYTVDSSDIIYRGYGTPGSHDFLKSTCEDLRGADIITNPPYVMAQQFIQHAIENTDKDAKIAMLLRLTFLESQKRKALFDMFPLTSVFVFRSRIGCAKNGDFKVDSHGELSVPSAVAYAWFLWDKTQFDVTPPDYIGLIK